MVSVITPSMPEREHPSFGHDLCVPYPRFRTVERRIIPGLLFGADRANVKDRHAQPPGEILARRQRQALVFEPGSGRGSCRKLRLRAYKGAAVRFMDRIDLAVDTQQHLVTRRDDVEIDPVGPRAT